MEGILSGSYIFDSDNSGLLSLIARMFKAESVSSVIRVSVNFGIGNVL